MTAELPHSSDAAPQAWDVVERTLQQLADLAGRQDVEAGEFHRQLLGDLVRLLAADGGAVWLFDSAGQLKLECQIEAERWGLEEGAFHEGLLVEALRRSKPHSAEPGSSSASGHANPSDCRFSLCSIRVDDVPAGVVEVCHRRPLSPEAHEGVERLLLAVVEVAADFHRRGQSLAMRRSLKSVASINQFAERVHASLDPRRTAYAIANEARVLLGCDRVTVLRIDGRRCRVAAVSGVERIDQRGDEVAALERLGGVVAHTGEAIWHDDRQRASAELADLLERHVDVSHARQVAALPMTPSDEEGAPVVGVLVLEQMTSGWPVELRERSSSVARHSAVALNNATEHGTLPLLFLSRWLRGFTWLFGPSGRPRAALIALALATVTAVLLLAPAELHVTARGRAHPQRRAHVFAPFDADVESIAIEDGTAVQTGDLLLMLRSAALETERDQAAAKLQTAATRLEVIDIELVGGGETDDGRRARLAAERKEVELLVEIHQQHLSDVEGKLQRLRIVSPIDGEVLTWQLENLLADRPVARGQRLLTVAEADGPWLLELDVRDYDAAHLRRAPRGDSARPVQFMLESLPGRTMTGRVQQLAESATIDEQGRAVVKLIVSVDSPPDGLRPGAVAVARIPCGTTRLGYAWFHDLIDAVRSWVWL